MSDEPAFHEIEQPAGAPLVAPLQSETIDECRRNVYQSYERFLRSRLQELDHRREEHWRRDYASIEAYIASVAPMRRRLQEMLGFWIEPPERRPLVIQDRKSVYSDDTLEAFRFTFDVLPGVISYAIELVPRDNPRAGLLIQHGYGATPEAACGFVASANADDYSYRSFGLRAARRGFHVVAVHHPSSFGALDDVILTPPPGFDHQTHAYGKNRLHRLAIMSRGTLFGLDMMASSRGLDYLASQTGGLPVGMYGLSQGGQSALYLPAMDTRIEASVCSAFFNDRVKKLIGPSRALCYLDSHEEDKFFAETIGLFCDADLVSLIAPRAFAVEAGEQDAAVDFEQSFKEFQRARSHFQKLGRGSRIEFIAHHQGHISGTRRAFEFLEQNLLQRRASP